LPEGIDVTATAESVDAFFAFWAYHEQTGSQLSLSTVAIRPRSKPLLVDFECYRDISSVNINTNQAILGRLGQTGAEPHLPTNAKRDRQNSRFNVPS